jgi:predicted RND superfamily exporter protein
MTSAEDISKMFEDEFQKLITLFDTADSKTEINIHEIVETYYQVMNVSSMITMLKQQTDSEPEELLEKITQTEKLISERFDSSIHPKIMDHLSSSIQSLTKNLQSETIDEKSKEQIEKDAKLFDELRQTMSTKEFVEQYETGLAHD